MTEVFGFLASIVTLHEFVSKTRYASKSMRSLAACLPLLIQTLNNTCAQTQSACVDRDVEGIHALMNDTIEEIAIVQRSLSIHLPRTGDAAWRRFAKRIKSIAFQRKLRPAIEIIYRNLIVLNSYQTTKHADDSKLILQQLSQFAVTPRTDSHALGLRLSRACRTEPDAIIEQEKELRQFHSYISPPETSGHRRVVSIVGLGGVVETQLSLAYAREYADSFKSISWLDDWLVSTYTSNAETGFFALALEWINGNIISSNEPQYWKKARRIIEHVVHLRSPRFERLWQTHNFDEESLEMVRSITDLLHRFDLNKQAEQLSLVILTRSENILGYDHQTTRNICGDLGDLYNVQDRLKEARSMYWRANGGFELGEETDLDSMTWCFNLASLHLVEGNLKDAEEALISALERFRAQPTTDPQSLLGLEAYLGIVYLEQGRLDDAEELFVQVQDGIQKSATHDYNLISVVYISIGTLFQRMGKTGEAERMYNQVLAIFKVIDIPKNKISRLAVKGLREIIYDTGNSETEALLKRFATVDYDVLYPHSTGIRHRRTVNFWVRSWKKDMDIFRVRT